MEKEDKIKWEHKNTTKKSPYEILEDMIIKAYTADDIKEIKEQMKLVGMSLAPPSIDMFYEKEITVGAALAISGDNLFLISDSIESLPLDQRIMLARDEEIVDIIKTLNYDADVTRDYDKNILDKAYHQQWKKIYTMIITKWRECQSNSEEMSITNLVKDINKETGTTFLTEEQVITYLDFLYRVEQLGESTVLVALEDENGQVWSHSHLELNNVNGVITYRARKDISVTMNGLDDYAEFIVPLITLDRFMDNMGANSLRTYITEKEKINQIDKGKLTMFKEGSRLDNLIMTHLMTNSLIELAPLVPKIY